MTFEKMLFLAKKGEASASRVS